MYQIHTPYKRGREEAHRAIRDFGAYHSHAAPYIKHGETSTSYEHPNDTSYMYSTSKGVQQSTNRQGPGSRMCQIGNADGERKREREESTRRTTVVTTPNNLPCTRPRGISSDSTPGIYHSLVYIVLDRVVFSILHVSPMMLSCLTTLSFWCVVCPALQYF